MQKRSHKSWSNYWTGHSQEIVTQELNLAKIGLNRNNGSENPLISDVYDNNFKLNSKIPYKSLKKSKQAFRADVSKKRSDLTKDSISKSSSLICDNFISSPFYENSGNIALYFPIRNEVDPLSILNHAVKLGKNVLLPKMDDGSLTFHMVKDLEGLVLNKFGIYEPGPDSVISKVEDIDLFIVPGLAFDSKGNRLGYGKGYYDKALSLVTSNKIIGFCYNFQIFNLLPNDRLDKNVGYLVSEDGVLGCKS